MGRRSTWQEIRFLVGDHECLVSIPRNMQKHVRQTRPFRWNWNPQDLVESRKCGHRKHRAMESNELIQFASVLEWFRFQLT